MRRLSDQQMQPELPAAALTCKRLHILCRLYKLCTHDNATNIFLLQEQSANYPEAGDILNAQYKPLDIGGYFVI